LSLGKDAIHSAQFKGLGHVTWQTLALVILNLRFCYPSVSQSACQWAGEFYFYGELKLFHFACVLKNLHNPDITVTEIDVFKKLAQIHVTK
jgi:hypothetical protein